MLQKGPNTSTPHLSILRLRSSERGPRTESGEVNDGDLTSLKFEVVNHQVLYVCVCVRNFTYDLYYYSIFNIL